MGAKKKGKANKLARMSEEEKLRYLQHRAAIEEEARRRKEQLISIFMKNKLKREEAFSRLNMAKINQEWRQNLRQIKSVELKEEVEDLYKWFNETIDKKNKIIQVLLEDLSEAENQHLRIQQCQMETFDKLILINGERVKHFQKLFEKEKNRIYEKACADLKDIIASSVTDEEHLQCIIYRMSETTEEKLSGMNSRHNSKMEELQNEMLTDLENLKNTRESKIEKIWEKFGNILKDYWEQTEDRRRQYVIMRDTDHENCKLIFENNQQINEVIDVIVSLKDELHKAKEIAKKQLNECMQERENSRETFYSLKKKIVEEQEMDKKNLNFMSSASGKVTNDLKDVLHNGERILQVHTLCRKYETLNEKICPDAQDKPQLTADEETICQEQFEKFFDPLAEKICKEFSKLDGFWKRYNRVLLEKEALVLHHQSLLNEQKQLKIILKGYLSDCVIKQPESKVSYANCVQIYQRRPTTNVVTSRKYPFSVITCVEATQSPSIRHYLASQRKTTR